MQFPPSFWDVTIWLGVTALVLLATAELTSPYHSQTNLPINNERLENVAITMGTLFLVTVVIHIYMIVS